MSNSANLAVARDAFAITPSDTVGFTASARGVYVGVGGTVIVRTPRNTVITFLNVPQGAVLPVECTRVNATGTTATNLVGLV